MQQLKIEKFQSKKSAESFKSNSVFYQFIWYFLSVFLIFFISFSFFQGLGRTLSFFFSDSDCEGDGCLSDDGVLCSQLFARSDESA